MDVSWLTDLTDLLRQELGLLQVPLEVSFLFTDDETIQKYNHTYRGHNCPTNVLSFPSYEREALPAILDTLAAQPLMLGDIVFAFETLEKEAALFQIPFEHHFTHLFFHGFLHLLGYDHETNHEAEHMETLEIRLLAQKSIPNPYKSCQNPPLDREPRGAQ